MAAWDPAQHPRNVLGQLAFKSLVEIRLDAESVSRLLYKMTGVKEKFLDLTELWVYYQQSFFLAEKQLFATQGATGELGEWQELSPKYARWKARHYPGATILVLSGALRSSLTSAGDPNYYFKVSRQRMEIGTHVKYAKYHQEGIGRMPVRQPLSITSEAEAAFFWPALQAWGDKIGRKWAQ